MNTSPAKKEGVSRVLTVIFVAILLLTLAIGLFYYLSAKSATGTAGFSSLLSYLITGVRPTPASKPLTSQAKLPVSPQDIPDFTNTFASASLNNLELVSLNQGGVEINGLKYPKLDLTTSLTFLGETKEITVSFVDKLDYKGTSGVAVSDIELKEGQEVSVRFWYVPSNFSTAQDKLKALCESKNLAWCWHAYLQGFGQTPVDFPDYLKSLFEANDVVVLDYGILLPVALEISS